MAGVEKARKQAGISRREQTSRCLSSLSPRFLKYTVEGEGPDLECLVLACGVRMFFGVKEINEINPYALYSMAMSQARFIETKSGKGPDNYQLFWPPEGLTFSQAALERERECQAGSGS